MLRKGRIICVELNVLCVTTNQSVLIPDTCYGPSSENPASGYYPDDICNRLCVVPDRNVVLASAEFRAGPRRSDRKGSSSQLAGGDPAASYQSLGQALLGTYYVHHLCCS